MRRLDGPTARRLIGLCLLIALLAPAMVLLGAVGTRRGWFDWRFGFGTLTLDWAPKAAIAGVAAGVIALALAAMARREGWRRTRWLTALASLALPLLVLGGFGALRAQAARVPPIHDVSTDWRDPPAPSPRLLAARGPDANPIPGAPPSLREGRPEVENWADDDPARIGAERCAAARSVRLALPPAQAEAAVERALREAGLTVAPDAAPGRVEAVATSFWYGFKDDVIARVRPEGADSRIDLRSVSRVGVSDLGANCRRVTEIARTLSG